MEESYVFGALEREKNSMRKIILTTVLIGLGINIIASGLSNITKNDDAYIFQIIFGLVLSVVVLVVNAISNYSKLSKSITFNSIVFYNYESNEILPVDSYEFSEDLHRFQNAAFIEKKALKVIWDNAPLGKNIRSENDDFQGPIIPDKSRNLVHELIEYCILERLSTHLCDYFQRTNVKNIDELSGFDIPDILLSNRFLKLFTEDMSNRDLFDGAPCCSIIQHTQNSSSVIRALHPSGAMYSKFDLILPHNTKVSRTANAIVISTDFFDLCLNIEFDGYSSNLPRYFSEYYIGVDDNIVIPFLASVSVSFRFKRRTFLSSRHSAYYLWADEFLKVLHDYLSDDQFFKKIGWQTIQTSIICQNNKNEEQKK